MYCYERQFERCIIMSSDRIENLRRNLDESIDLMLILNPKNVFYFSNYYPHADTFLFISNGGKELMVPSLEYDDARTRAKHLNVIKMEANKGLLDILVNALKDRMVKNVGIEENFITFNYFNYIQKKLEDINLVPANNKISKLRYQKNTQEIALMQRAAEITDAAMNAAIKSIKVGMTETEVAGIIEHEMRKKGSQGTAFETIVASGPNSALPHATSSERKIQKSEIVLMDIGALYKGYCNDMTRTVVLGKPKDKQREFYKTVLKAKKQTEDGFTMKMLGSDLDKIPRKIIDIELGMPFIHGLGHGVGIDIHESPTLGPTSKDILDEGTVFTIEPGVYEFGYGGVRLEDTYYVKYDGSLQPLNKVPFEFEI